MFAAKLFAENGIRMMLMKGYGLSLDWPVPEHRPTGDIDIFLFGDKERADRLVEEKLGVKVLEDVFAEKERLPMSTAGIRGWAKVEYGVQKSLRWWRNRWKYRLVYDETMWESFWGLAWNRVRGLLD